MALLSFFKKLFSKSSQEVEVEKDPTYHYYEVSISSDEVIKELESVASEQVPVITPEPVVVETEAVKEQLEVKKKIVKKAEKKTEVKPQPAPQQKPKKDKTKK
jgi:hypothetical protein